MRLRALDLMKKPVHFSVQDVPTLLNPNIVILAKREGSPLLDVKTIMRGSDDGLFYESDFVISKEHKGVIGFVVYTDGFYIWDDKADTLTPIRDTGTYTFVENTQMYLLDEINAKRGRIKFGYRDRRFGLEKIIYFKDNELYISLKTTGYPVYLDHIKYGTGLVIDETEVCYGDVCNRGVVCLHQYHPMIKTYNGRFVELEEDDYDSLGTTRNS